MTMDMRMMCSEFASPWLRNPIPYSHDLIPCDFFCPFPKFKKMPWKDKDLLAILTSNATWRYCEVFRKTIFKTVSGSGTMVSRSA
jgi:hypothetical protein